MKDYRYFCKQVSSTPEYVKRCDEIRESIRISFPSVKDFVAEFNKKDEKDIPNSNLAILHMKMAEHIISKMIGYSWTLSKMYNYDDIRHMAGTLMLSLYSQVQDEQERKKNGSV